MKKSVRLILALILGFFIYFLAGNAIPSIGFISELVRKYDWLLRSDITQITFLVVSLVFIYLFGKGDVGNYGLKPVKLSEIKKPALISFVISFIVIGTGMILVMKGGPPAIKGEDSIMSSGFLKGIISVWVIASISEEVLFRGLLQGFLNPLKDSGINLFNTHISVPVIFSALFFAFGHIGVISIMSTEMTVLIVINATILGFIAGYYRERTGSLITAIVVHMIFNIVGNILGVLIERIMTV